MKEGFYEQRLYCRAAVYGAASSSHHQCYCHHFPAGYGRGKRHPHGAGGQRRKTEPIEVDTLPKSLSLDETYEGTPYTTYDITIRAFNFANQLIRRVQVFESEITLQQVELIPFDREAYNNNTDFIFETPAHSLTQEDQPQQTALPQPPGEFFTAGSDPAGAAARDRSQPACSASGNTPRQCGKCLCLFSGLH